MRSALGTNFFRQKAASAMFEIEEENFSTAAASGYQAKIEALIEKINGLIYS